MEGSHRPVGSSHSVGAQGSNSMAQRKQQARVLREKVARSSLPPEKPAPDLPLFGPLVPMGSRVDDFARMKISSIYGNYEMAKQFVTSPMILGAVFDEPMTPAPAPASKNFIPLSPEEGPFTCESSASGMSSQSDDAHYGPPPRRTDLSRPNWSDEKTNQSRQSRPVSFVHPASRAGLSGAVVSPSKKSTTMRLHGRTDVVGDASNRSTWADAWRTGFATKSPADANRSLNGRVGLADANRPASRDRQDIIRNRQTTSLTSGVAQCLDTRVQGMVSNGLHRSNGTQLNGTTADNRGRNQKLIIPAAPARGELEELVDEVLQELSVPPLLSGILTPKKEPLGRFTFHHCPSLVDNSMIHHQQQQQKQLSTQVAELKENSKVPRRLLDEQQQSVNANEQSVSPRMPSPTKDVLREDLELSSDSSDDDEHVDLLELEQDTPQQEEDRPTVEQRMTVVAHGAVIHGSSDAADVVAACPGATGLQLSSDANAAAASSASRRSSVSSASDSDEESTDSDSSDDESEDDGKAAPRTQDGGVGLEEEEEEKPAKQSSWGIHNFVPKEKPLSFIMSEISVINPPSSSSCSINPPSSSSGSINPPSSCSINPPSSCSPAYEDDDHLDLMGKNVIIGSNDDDCVDVDMYVDDDDDQMTSGSHHDLGSILESVLDSVLLNGDHLESSIDLPELTPGLLSVGPPSCSSSVGQHSVLLMPQLLSQSPISPSIHFEQHLSSPTPSSRRSSINRQLSDVSHILSPPLPIFPSVDVRCAAQASRVFSPPPASSSNPSVVLPRLVLPDSPNCRSINVRNLDAHLRFSPTPRYSAGVVNNGPCSTNSAARERTSAAGLILSPVCDIFSRSKMSGLTVVDGKPAVVVQIDRSCLYKSSKPVQTTVTPRASSSAVLSPVKRSREKHPSKAPAASKDISLLPASGSKETSVSTGKSNLKSNIGCNESMVPEDGYSARSTSKRKVAKDTSGESSEPRQKIANITYPETCSTTSVDPDVPSIPQRLEVTKTSKVWVASADRRYATDSSSTERTKVSKTTSRPKSLAVLEFQHADRGSMTSGGGDKQSSHETLVGLKSSPSSTRPPKKEGNVVKAEFDNKAEKSRNSSKRKLSQAVYGEDGKPDNGKKLCVGGASVKLEKDLDCSATRSRNDVIDEKLALTPEQRSSTKSLSLPHAGGETKISGSKIKTEVLSPAKSRVDGEGKKSGEGGERCRKSSSGASKANRKSSSNSSSLVNECNNSPAAIIDVKTEASATKPKVSNAVKQQHQKSSGGTAVESQAELPKLKSSTVPTALASSAATVHVASASSSIVVPLLTTGTGTTVQQSKSNGVSAQASKSSGSAVQASPPTAEATQTADIPDKPLDRRKREDELHTVPLLLLPKLEVSDRIESAEFYYNEARRLKHEGESERDSYHKILLHLDSSVSFITHGFALERNKASNTLIDKLYRDTLAVHQHYCSNRAIDAAVQDTASQQHKGTISILSLRLQSIIYQNLFNLKKPDASKLKISLESEMKNGAKPFALPSSCQLSVVNSSVVGWTQANGTLSPISPIPQPSPAGSITSIGSAGSSNSTGLDSTLARTTNGLTAPSVVIPERTHSMMLSYFGYISCLHQACELWDESNSIVRNNTAAADFIQCLEAEHGHVDQHCSLSSFSRYFKDAIRRLRLL